MLGWPTSDSRPATVSGLTSTPSQVEMEPRPRLLRSLQLAAGPGASPLQLLCYHPKATIHEEGPQEGILNGRMNSCGSLGQQRALEKLSENGKLAL